LRIGRKIISGASYSTQCLGCFHVCNYRSLKGGKTHQLITQQCPKQWLRTIFVKKAEGYQVEQLKVLNAKAITEIIIQAWKNVMIKYTSLFCGSTQKEWFRTIFANKAER
jgi:hypothetical protein